MLQLNADTFEQVTGRKPVNTDGPESVLQFGEGNFLRAFCDWMIHRANTEGVYNGKVVVVQPRNRPQGTVSILNSQNCLYSVAIRGIENDSIVDNCEVVESVSRGINPYTNWDDFLACGRNTDLRFVLSNTTEAGVVYTHTPKPTDNCPDSFPAKLTKLLHERWLFFNGDSERGLIILPCELINDNGSVLKNIVLQHVDDWSLESGFIQWLNQSCSFCNTLVDRIVPGYPAQDNQDSEIFKKTGLSDKLLSACEPYHIWAIEADEKIAAKLPLQKAAGVNLVWTDDLEKYRYRKVRILNGSHMAMVPVGHLAGCELVSEALADDLVGDFVRKLMETEVLPVLDIDEAEKQKYYADTLSRFANPFIKHKLLTISLNSTSKFRYRLMHSLCDFLDKNSGQTPELISLAFAGLIRFYKAEKFDSDLLIGCYENRQYTINDDSSTLKLWHKYWAKFTINNNAKELVTTVLKNIDWWGQDLNKHNGLCECITKHLKSILSKGMRKTLAELV